MWYNNIVMAEKKNQNFNKKGRAGKETETEESFLTRVKGDAKRSVVAIFLFALAALLVLSFFDAAGYLGVWLNDAFGLLVGWGKWALPFVLVFSGVVLLRRKETSFYVIKLLGIFVVFWSLLGFFHLYFDEVNFVSAAKSGSGGGFSGLAVAYLLKRFTGELAGSVILGAVFAIGVIVTFNFSIVDFVLRMGGWRQMLSRIKFKKKDENNGNGEKREEESNESEEDQADGKNEDTAENLQTNASPNHGNIGKLEFVGEDDSDESGRNEGEEINGTARSKNRRMVNGANKDPGQLFRQPAYRSNSPWQFPTFSLLDDATGGARGGDVKKNVETIQRTLQHFNIEVEPGDVLIGPAVTQYSFKPAVGVKLSKIVGLSNDLSLALAASSIRIEAPIPGKSLVGIEVPNKKTAMVRLKELLKSNTFNERKSNLMLALGKDISGNYVFGNLEKMPHLMIAGSTGSGKSVCINAVLLSLLYQNSPDDLQLILVDPKRVELSLYNGIPHLIGNGVIVENNKVVNALRWAVVEMEKRYRMLQDTGSRDIASFNQKAEQGEKRRYFDENSDEEVEEDLNRIPYIVIVIDELADLMASHGKEVEGAIVRLAQMARAVGIHLIISTQRPSVEVITGLIKANVITRIAFQVASQVDSRTILDMSGAEKLLGNGDMLFLSSESPKPKRLQGVYVSEQEVKKVVRYIKEQSGSRYLENIGEAITEAPENKHTPSQNVDFSTSGLQAEEDSLFEEARNMVIRSKKASTSFLQRHLRIGYSRAARLIDTLEEKGIVGPENGSKPREVLVGASSESDNKKATEYDDPEKDQLVRDKWQL